MNSRKRSNIQQCFSCGDVRMLSKVKINIFDFSDLGHLINRKNMYKKRVKINDLLFLLKL